ncbi:MAG: CDP-alcohol phosphatidyltransferase family protein [Anaerolineaceae bacterium]|nr:CDP-alcohol phosphatidyltransferase family protein [Anaerolineaceae bacterium]
MEQVLKKKKPKSLTDTLRALFKNVLDPIAILLVNLGFKPNMITLLGLVGHIIAAYLVSRGLFIWGAIVIILMGPLDAVDGAMARYLGEVTTFGAFLDSITDRYSELILFGGLLFYYMQQSNWLICGLIYLSAAGSILVSYTRARAEALGFDAKIGLLTRVERYLVLVPGMLFNYVQVAIWIMAIFTNFTALQRIYYVRRQSRQAKTLEQQVHSDEQ